MNKNERRVIYVDAGQNENKEFQIALFDPKINLTSIIKLINIDNNHIAEKYAIVNAITYIKSKGLSRTVILSDNESAVNDQKILKLCKNKNNKVYHKMVIDRIEKKQKGKHMSLTLNDLFTVTQPYTEETASPEEQILHFYENVLYKKNTHYREGKIVRDFPDSPEIILVPYGGKTYDIIGYALIKHSDLSEDGHKFINFLKVEANNIDEELNPDQLESILLFLKNNSIF